MHMKKMSRDKEKQRKTQRRGGKSEYDAESSDHDTGCGRHMVMIMESQEWDDEVTKEID